MGDVSGKFGGVNMSFRVASSGRMVTSDSCLILPNMKTFKDTVRGLEPFRSMVGRRIRGSGPFLKVYLNRRVLVDSDRRSINIGNLSLFGKRTRLLSKSIGVPRVN